MEESIRRMHLIFNSGIGAISSLRSFSGILKHPSIDKDNWQYLPKIYENRLQSLLNVSYFKQPSSDKKAALNFRAFPRMYSCPNCRDLKPIDQWFPQGLDGLSHLRCTNKIKSKKGNLVNCMEYLVPSRFVMICPDGHMDDFPYFDWVHRYNGCSGGNPAGLKIYTKGEGSTLANINIKCLACGITRKMGEALSADRHISEGGGNYYKCTGRRYERHQNIAHRENCNHSCSSEHGSVKIRFVLRTAASVYFPIIYTALSLPEYQLDNEVVYLHNDPTFQLYLASDNDIVKNTLYNSIKLVFQTLFPGHHDSKYENWIKEAENSFPDPSAPKDLELFKNQEFISLCKTQVGRDFICTVKGFSENRYMIEAVSEVEKLKQIATLAGYTRIFPRLPENAFDNPVEADVKVTYLSAEDNQKRHWLPAVELFGEGLFIKFSDEQIDHRIKDNLVIEKSIETIYRRRDEYIQEMGGAILAPNARFIALHSLSHQIIKEISFETGYSLASLKERIYCNLGSNHLMNGILIYVVEADVLGTLGGLSRLAVEGIVIKIIERSLKHSEYCSNDPVCFESHGQGLGGLNLAACHSCLLLPETCCEFGNRFLDRKIMNEVFN